MKIYLFDPQTQEFIGAVQARQNPRTNTPLIPAHATPIKPPAVNRNQIAVFEAGDWHIKPDHRGTKYWLEDGTEHEITNIATAPPQDALYEAPLPLENNSQSKVKNLVKSLQILGRRKQAAPTSI